MTHVFACLVHERPEVVGDLVANLQFLEPGAAILLYDGSPNGRLLNDSRVPRGGQVVIHPRPRPMRWGRLHDFAIDSMRFALAGLDMDALTIVDSDQVLLRPGFVQRVAAHFAAHPGVGMLGNAPDPQPTTTTIAPARLVWREADLWRPVLARFPRGAEAFPHWTFWPTTVFARDAAAALVDRFDERDIQATLRRSRIFATEEIVLPTLVAALGYEVARSPESYEFVRFRVAYATVDADRALERPDAFWMHPVPRRLDDPLRAHLRHAVGWPAAPVAAVTAPGAPSRARAITDDGTFVDLARSAWTAFADLAPGASLTVRPRAGREEAAAALVRLLAMAHGAEVRPAGRVVSATRVHEGESAHRRRQPPPDLGRLVAASGAVNGWLEEDEAVFLAAATHAALITSEATAVVELGSFCGRGTVVLGGVAATTPGAGVHAIDRFDGIVGEAGRLFQCGPTRERFDDAIRAAGVGAVVHPVEATPAEAPWRDAIALLLVDGWHDYASVAADFVHYEPWLDPAGFVAFHDYASYYPGVRRLVDELVAGGRWASLGRVGTLIVLRRTTARRESPVTSPVPVMAGEPPAPRADQPLVSCIMLTFDRRAYVPDAIARFLGQDYANSELLVIDDGTDPVEDLVPADDRVRYLRLDRRLSIGAKRNLGCEAAYGSILAHWDDDDWVASWRLRYQVEALQASGADLVGLSTLLYLDPAAGDGWRYEYGSAGRPWVHDPTFCYRRETWEAERFPDANHGLDVRYLHGGRRKRVSVLADHRFYVGIIHGGNTSRKETRGSRWRPLGRGVVEALIAADGRDQGASASAARPSALAPSLLVSGRAVP